MIDLTETQQSALYAIEGQFKGDEITGKEVAKSIRLKDRDSGKEGADIRAVINALRKKGYPVCANSKGYFYPRDRQEIIDYIDSLSGRIKSETEALDGMRSAILVWDEVLGVREPVKQGTIEI